MVGYLFMLDNGDMGTITAHSKACELCVVRDNSGNPHVIAYSKRNPIIIDNGVATHAKLMPEQGVELEEGVNGDISRYKNNKTVVEAHNKNPQK